VVIGREVVPKSTRERAIFYTIGEGLGKLVKRVFYFTPEMPVRGTSQGGLVAERKIHSR